METDGRTDRRRDATNRIHYSPHILWWGDKKRYRRYEVDTKCYERTDGRAMLFDARWTLSVTKAHVGSLGQVS